MKTSINFDTTFGINRIPLLFLNHFLAIDLFTDQSYPMDLDSIKEEVSDEDGTTIRIVGIETIATPHMPMPAARPKTRQPYNCDICHSKFRTVDSLEKHKMTHCFVKISSLGSDKVQQIQVHQAHDESMHSEIGDTEDMEFQPVEDDSDSSASDSASLSKLQSTPNQRRSKAKKSNLIVTKRRIRNAGDFTCNVCEKKFNEQRLLVRHMKLHHPETFEAEMKLKKYTTVRRQRNAGNYPCSICQKRLAGEQGVRQHKRMFHPDEYQLELAEATQKPIPQPNCRVCGEQFQSFALLKEHKETSHAKPKPTEKELLKCDTCNAVFSSRGALLQHNRSIHLKLKPFSCPECGKTFTRNYHYLRHKDLHLDVKKYKCPHCPKCFQQKVGRDLHIKTHFRLENQVQCSLCGQLFSRVCINQHIQEVHEGLRPHACTKCDKTFKKKTHLQYHIKTHDNPQGRKRGLNKEREVRVRRAAVNINKLETVISGTSNSDDLQVTPVANPGEAEVSDSIADRRRVVAPTELETNEAEHIGLPDNDGHDYQQWILSL